MSISAFPVELACRVRLGQSALRKKVAVYVWQCKKWLLFHLENNSRVAGSVFAFPVGEWG